MKKIKLLKILLILSVGICFFINNYYDNLSRVELNNGTYTDVYMNGTPFLITGFILLIILLILTFFQAEN